MTAPRPARHYSPVIYGFLIVLGTGVAVGTGYYAWDIEGDVGDATEEGGEARVEITLGGAALGLSLVGLAFGYRARALREAREFKVATFHLPRQREPPSEG